MLQTSGRGKAKNVADFPESGPRFFPHPDLGESGYEKMDRTADRDRQGNWLW